MGNWSDLNSDVLGEIARRIECFEDFIAFAAVCRACRLVAKHNQHYFNSSASAKVPWLMLSKKEEEEDYSRSWQFLNLSKGKIYKISLPEEGNSYLTLSSYTYRSIYGDNETQFYVASQGWYLIKEEEKYLSLLNPFSLTKFYLPRNIIIRGDAYYSFKSETVIGFALSCSPTRTSDYIAMVINLTPVHGYSRLAFCKHADPGWTSVDLPPLSCTYREISFYDGRFYAFHKQPDPHIYHVLEIDIEIQDSTVSTRTISFKDPYWYLDRTIVPRDHEILWDCRCWLTEYSTGVLMMVFWNWNYELDQQLAAGIYSDNNNHHQFIVEAMELKTGECRQVNDFGNKALFLGQGSCYFVDVSDESTLFKPNHIYSLDNSLGIFWKRSRSVTVYNMLDGRRKPLFNEAECGRNSSVLWIEPRF
ncbi:uncharacterized protein LOC112533792 [Ricinus communis]|uniref:KIB1-4 beta-propeller domain-containing protein n=1 Tax=Ricinus communis TaxID=3988 RepID=B9RGD3_RICCO|nr:uncharacterized protein LOC112533792 [Ricinus communis]EEF49588.1 conserved hypothetical protein [Ricinus communis]|eukprot:XP_025011995.1 uncharacterized protein LOC112533792 [Ricinus communis]